MIGYDLPTSVELGGRRYAFRSDYRPVLDVISVMCEPDDPQGRDERAIVALSIFYEDFDAMPLRCFQAAMDYLQWFVNGGEDAEPSAKKPKLMDWEQDFPLIVAPVNRVIGKEIRSIDYMHWWTFLSAYREIGECLFGQVVSIRSKKARGQRLDKMDERFYAENRSLVDFKVKETASEKEILEAWT